MNEKEKIELAKKKKARYLEKLKTGYKESTIPLGHYLLEKEFERKKAAEDLIEKHNLDKTKSTNG